MTKNELIEAIAGETGKPKTVISDILSAATRVAQTMLKSGNDVVLGDFGKLSVGRREAREGRNLHTGEKIQIAAKTVVKFKPSKSLSDAVA